MSVPTTAAARLGGEGSAGRPDDGRADDAGPPVGEAAFTAGFQQHYPTCLRLARRVVRDEGLAHEVVQEVFLAWWRAPGGAYRADRGELGTWLSTLTHHKAVDAVRTSEKHRRLLAAAASEVPYHPEQRLVEDVVWWEEGRQSLLAALPTLKPLQREVLDLAYVSGLTQAEIAERLGIPLGTVKSRTHAGMLRLRAAMGGTWTPTGPPEDPSTDGPSLLSLMRPAHGARSGAAARTGTVHVDVARCASALVRMASTEVEHGAGHDAMVRQAAAVVDEHGEAGLYDLVVALARLAAAGAGASSPSPSAYQPRAVRASD